ncbi:MAG TPA: response regulator, partial [Polyangiaceae bacterium]|nr:response regulator [Polyangiaceae bacterium]
MSDDAAVLIIDDDDLVRRAFRRTLERGGYAVREAKNGRDGLAQAARQLPAAVLLDLRMPGLDGLDVLSGLVQDHPDLPVVVVSGQGTMEDVVEALRRGAWDFLSKPVMDPEIFVRTIARGIEKATLIRQNREYSETLRGTNQRLSAALDELRNDEQAARALQFQLLPEDDLELCGYRFSRRLLPSHLLSGDFLDYFPLGERQVGFYLADVSGHGAASAFVTAILTTLVSKYREGLVSREDATLLEPAQLLARLDADLAPLGLPKHVTMFYGVLDADRNQLRAASAGAFPFPLVRRGASGAGSELECSGRPLNLPGPRQFGTVETSLPSGSALLLASDGV